MMNAARQRNRRASKRYFAALETLEPRQLLTVDLSGAFTAFPSSAISGTKQAMTLQLTNNGTTKASGSLAISFFAEPDGVDLDVITAVPLGTFNTSMNMNASASQNVILQVPISPALAAGDYRIYAVIDPLNKIVETNNTNNTVQSTILAVTQPDYDLVPTFGNVTIPATLVAGDVVNGTVQVIVTNPSTSTATLGANISIPVQIFARPSDAADETLDTSINKSTINIAVGGLAPGKSKTINVPVTFANLTTGSYDIVAVIDGNETVSETAEENNVITLGSTTVISERTTNLAVSLNNKTTLPLTTVISDGIRKLSLKLDVGVTGNRPTSSTQKINVEILAHPHDGIAEDVTIQSLTNVSLGAVQSGKFKTLTFTPTIPFGMASNNYDFYAVVTASELPSDASSDNTATTETLLAPVTVTRGFYDIQATVASTTIPLAIVEGVAKTGNVKVDVTNIGNVLLPAVQRVNITAVLRPSNASDASQDITIGTLSNQSIAKLAANGKKTFTVNANVSAVVDAADYVLWTFVTPVEAITEELLTNNSDSGATITIAPAFVNLDIATATQTFAASVLGGAHATGNVTVSNLGNVPAVGNVNVQFFATTTGNIEDGVNIGEKSFALNLLNGKTGSTMAVTLTLPDVASASDYTIIAQIVPSGFTDTNSSDNTQTAGSVVHAAPAFVDLDIATATHAFGANVLGGAHANGSVTFANLGNVPAIGNVNVQFFATTTGDINDGTLVGEKSFAVNLANGKTSSTMTVALTLPTGASAQNYTIISKIVNSNFEDTNSSNNTQTAGGAVHADPATVDLHLNSVVSPFTSNAVGGAKGTATFTLDNFGTIPAVGNVTVTYYATAAGSLNADATNGTIIGSTTLSNLNIGSNGITSSKQVSLTLPNPDATTSLHIFARVTPVGPLLDNNTANNETTVGTVSTTHLTSVFPLTHGNVISFHATQTNGGLGNFQQLGTFTTDVPGVTGTYIMTYTTRPDGDPLAVVNGISITFTGLTPPSYSVGLDYVGTAFGFGGKNLTFSYDDSGKKGTATGSFGTAFFK